MEEDNTEQNKFFQGFNNHFNTDPREELQNIKNKILSSDESLSPESIVNKLALNVASQTPEALFAQYNKNKENQIINNATGAVENNQSGLGNQANINSTDFLTNTFNKIAKIESNNNPNAVNPTTGAWGIGQIMPKFEKDYAKASNLTLEQLRTPEGQKKSLMDTIVKHKNLLEKNNLPVNAQNIYKLYQQGATGGLNILKHGKYNSKNLRGNIGANFLANAPEGEDLLTTYNNYWDSKFN